MGYLDYLGKFIAGTGMGLNAPRIITPWTPSGLGAALSGQSQPFASPGPDAPSTIWGNPGATPQSLIAPDVARTYATQFSKSPTQPISGGDTGGGGGQPPQPQQQPQGYWDKDFGDPNHPDLSNPIKQDAFRRYQESLRMQQESSPEYKAAQLKAQQEEQGAIDEAYRPAFSEMDRQKLALEAQQPGEQQTIEGQYARGLEGVSGQQSEAQMQLGRRGTESETAQANALANARQLYSELSQRYGTMFGSRSSAGPAAQELLNRETTRRFGEVGTAREQDRQAIANETTRLNTWVDTQKSEWGRKKDEALRQLQSSFQQQLGQINSQRGTMEIQKARDRATALTDARTRQAAVQQADKDFQQRLALFQAEKQSQLPATPQYGMNTWNSAVQGQYSGPQMGQQTTNQGTTGTTVAGNGDYLWEIDPRTGQRIPRRMI